jgi:5-methylcytosine-specific restriction endonuclease McrA
MNRQKTIHGTERPLHLAPGRVAKACTYCGRWFSLPACHAERHRSCSASCLANARDDRRRASVAARTRTCVECGDQFVARQWLIDHGAAKFCSVACGTKYFVRTPASAERWAKARAVRAHNRSTGEEKPQRQPKGAASPFWKGGAEASNQRRREKGGQRKYRGANPDKVREFTERRFGRKFGRLPRGTVAKLRERQRNRCAFCAKSLVDGYHLHHVMPLALGCKHEQYNVQLLCPTCNVRKSAKHPIRYAQEHGRLL